MSYIICFWDKSKIQVTNTMGEKLKEAIRTESIKTFDLGGNLYAVGGVEKIILKSDAFDVFPSEWEQLKNMEDKMGVLPALGDGIKRLN